MIFNGLHYSILYSSHPNDAIILGFSTGLTVCFSYLYYRTNSRLAKLKLFDKSEGFWKMSVFTRMSMAIKNLFLDESGECSFSARSIYKHFLLTVVSIDSEYIYKIKNRLTREFALLIRKGWNKSIERKANAVYHKQGFGTTAVSRVLRKLSTIPTLRVSYIVIKKDNIQNDSFRNAPYGTAYNYFARVLLSEMIFEDSLYDVKLVYDRRNKESHAKRHFKEYLTTEIYGMALSKSINVSLTIHPCDSQHSYGLMAADYFSWAIFRKFESGDDQFFNLFKQILLRRREWYINI